MRFAAIPGFLWAVIALLGSCAPDPEQPDPSPALWEVSDEAGNRGYLFGTVHALPDRIRWTTPTLEEAFAASDTLAVEVASLNSAQGMRTVFWRLATTPGQPTLAERVSPSNHALAMRVIDERGLDDSDYSEMETWAVALALAQLSELGDSRNGVDRALLSDAEDKKVVELEGIEKQLGLFDSLPEAEQSDLLEHVLLELDDDEEVDGLDHRLAAWLTGDMAALEESARLGMLSDPELHEVLLVRRNLEWADRIEELLAQGAEPFVAVGAAHMIGAQGLVDLLAQRGLEVRRIQ